MEWLFLGMVRDDLKMAMKFINAYPLDKLLSVSETAEVRDNGEVVYN